jgi:hypothetical protein
MNFEFIEDGEARDKDKVVKFRGVRIADEEIVHDKGEGVGSGVWSVEWVWWKHGGGSFREAVLGQERDKSELRLRVEIR